MKNLINKGFKKEDRYLFIMYGTRIYGALFLIFLILTSCNNADEPIINDPVFNKPKVLLISNSGTNSYDFTALAKNGLIATALFNEHDIDILENPDSISLSEIESYNAILLWTNVPFQNPQNIGEVVDKFIEGGGGVVFSTYLLMNGGAIGENWLPFSSGVSKPVVGEIDLLTLPDPNHFIFKSIDQNPKYWSNENYSNPVLIEGSNLIALDTQGNYVMAENPNGKVIFIEIFPGILNPENPVSNDECRLLFARSLYYVSN